jgi:hypothetical protein
MKKTLWVVVLCLFASPALAFKINSGISGSWFNPQRTGHGFAIEYTEQPGACEQIDGQGCLVVYWFVYDKEGNPIFLLGQLPVVGNVAAGEMLYFSGLQFGPFTPEPVPQSWGSLRLRFPDCESGFARYESGFMPPEGAQFNDSGSFKIQRLAFVSNLDCARAGRADTLPKSPIGGVWQGMALSDDFPGSSQGRELIMIADAENNVWLFGNSPSLAFQGKLNGDGTELSGTLDAKAVMPSELFDDEKTGSVDVQMNGRAGDFLEGSFNGTGVDADFELGYQPASQRPASMERLSRCWSLRTHSGRTTGPNTKIPQSGEFEVRFNIDDDGCPVNFSVAPSGEPWGLYRADATVSECGEFSGEYSGVMAIIDISVPGDDAGLLFALEGDNASLNGGGFRLKPDQCESE